MNKSDKNLNSIHTTIKIDHSKGHHSEEMIESQTGPQEEPCLVDYAVDIQQFRKYQDKKTQKKNKLF